MSDSIVWIQIMLTNQKKVMREICSTKRKDFKQILTLLNSIVSDYVSLSEAMSK